MAFLFCCFCGVLSFGVIVNRSYSQLPSSVTDDSRARFKEYVQKTFYTNIQYDLDKPLEETRQEFSNLMRCIFFSAEKEMKNHFNDLAKSRVQSFNGVFAVPNVVGDIESCPQEQESLKEFQEVQSKHGFRTLCTDISQEDKTKKLLITEDFSPCRVSELVINELAGYKEYLAFKQEDRASFTKEIISKKETGISSDYDRKLFGEWQEIYKAEQEIAEASAEDALWRYTDQFQSYIRIIDLWVKTSFMGVYAQNLDAWQRWLADAITRFPAAALRPIDHK